MNKIYISICALWLCAVTMAQAQGGNNTAFTYSVGFPVGDLHDFIQKTSFRGLSLDYHHMSTEKVGVGVSFGWNTFYEAKAYDTYTVGTASLSGKQYRYSNNFPMLFSADYFTTAGQKVIPFVGLGTGVIYTKRNTDMNLYTLKEDAWNFALQPEIGVQIGDGFNSAWTIMLKYYNGFPAGDLPKAQSYLTLNVGFVFKD